MEELELIVVEPEIIDETPGQGRDELAILMSIDVPTLTYANYAESFDDNALEQMIREIWNR